MRTSVFASPRRSGFTLIETVVTVGLIAVLAAFVIPTVIQKAGTADPVKVENDLGTLQTALSTFGNDLKGAYPADLNSLTTRLSSTPTFLLDGTTKYDASQVTQWNGPYIGATIPLGGTLLTGYAASLEAPLANYDATDNSYKIATNTITSLIDTGTPGQDGSDAHFVGVEITGLTIAQVKALNKLIDGAADTDATLSGTESLGANTTGRLRYNGTLAAATGPAKVFYLVVPVTK